MQRHSRRSPQKTPQPDVVEGRWLVKAFAGVVAAALLCTYATLCLLFYRGQWQLVLHPVRTTGPASQDEIRFASEATGQPQLAGEWLPATASNRYNQLTVLFLPGGDGTTASFSSTQTALREIGVNVFTFDYRGYGRSASMHPSEERMRQDTEHAWDYLTSTRHIAASRIVPYGVGVGASLAAELVSRHVEIPAVILDSPYTDLRQVIGNDSRFRFLPAAMLFHEDFPLRAPLARLQRPKLLIFHAGSGLPEAFQAAAAPKSIREVDASTGPGFAEAVKGFLTQVLPVSSTAPMAK